MRDGKDETELSRIEAALEPPNRLDPMTGRPYGWDETDGTDLSEFR